MRGTARNKVVTSGRLSGRVKVQPARRRVTPNPAAAAAACPEPTYSLYSTDSEDQVISLHKGLDRCAALLSGILQTEKAEASPSPPRAVKSRAIKSKASASLGKKTVKKSATQTGVKLHPPHKQHPTPLHPHLPPPYHQTLRHLSPTPPPQPQTSTPPPQAQTSVPPPQAQTSVPPPQSQTSVPPPQSQTSVPPPQAQTSVPPPRAQTSVPPPRAQTSVPPPRAQTSIPPPQPQTAIPPPQPQTSIPLPQTAPTDCKAQWDGEEEDLVPVKDINTHSTNTLSCTLKLSSLQLEAGQAEGPEETPSSAETQVRQTVKSLLGQLKALVAGQGSVAERLLSQLEQTVSSPVINVGRSNIQNELDLSLHSQNSQLHRRVRILQQQLEEKADKQQNMETLCNSQVLALQEQLTTAQSRLQELQDDLTHLQKAQRDTQSQLRDAEAENTLIKTDLEAARRQLLDSEREKTELALLAQQRLEEIVHLERTLQGGTSSPPPAAERSVPLSTRRHMEQQLQLRQDPAAPPTDCISHYLLSLAQLELQLKHTSSPPDVTCHRGDKPAARQPSTRLVQSHGSDEVLNSTVSQCDVESVWSDVSTASGSTFDTRAEAAFKDGLSALDASIASLQRTIQLDLRRC